MKWRDQIKIHPAADMFPLLPRDELLALSKDIVENGLREPPAFWKKYAHERDNEYELMDGRNRFDAIEVAGLEIVFKPRRAEYGPPFKIIVKKDGEPVEWGDDVDFKTFFSTEVDPYVYVASANIHRRHLTPEQKRDLIAKALKAQAHKSNREIGRQVQADHKTVGKVRAQMESTGDVPQLARTIGADGKARIVQRHEPREIIEEEEQPPPNPDAKFFDSVWLVKRYIDELDALLVEGEWQRISSDHRRKMIVGFMHKLAARLEKIAMELTAGGYKAE